MPIVHVFDTEEPAKIAAQRTGFVRHWNSALNIVIVPNTGLTGTKS